MSLIELRKHRFEGAHEVDWNNEILHFSRMRFWEGVVLSLDMVLNLKGNFCWCSLELAKKKVLWLLFVTLSKILNQFEVISWRWEAWLEYSALNKEIVTLWNFSVCNDFEKDGLGRRLLEEMTDLGAYEPTCNWLIKQQCKKQIAIEVLWNFTTLFEQGNNGLKITQIWYPFVSWNFNTALRIAECQAILKCFWSSQSCLES